MPATHPARAQVLDIYRRQMAAVRMQQAPDGAWRQTHRRARRVPGGNATAMILSAMARRHPRRVARPLLSAHGARAWRALAATSPTPERSSMSAPGTGGPDEGGTTLIVPAPDRRGRSRRRNGTACCDGGVRTEKPEMGIQNCRCVMQPASRRRAASSFNSTERSINSVGSSTSSTASDPSGWVMTTRYRPLFRSWLIS